MVPELIRTENRGRSTRVYIAGIEVGKSLKGFYFSQPESNVSDPEITATINIKAMLRVLSEVTPEQLENAKEIIKPYLEEYKRTVTGDGNSSAEDSK